jgi:hypothetical protein
MTHFHGALCIAVLQYCMATLQYQNPCVGIYAFEILYTVPHTRVNLKIPLHFASRKGTGGYVKHANTKNSFTGTALE